MIGRWLAVGAALLATATAGAQPQAPFEVSVGGVEAARLEGGLLLSVDADDDDEDGTADLAQVSGVMGDELVPFEVRHRAPVEVSVEGPLRLIRDGRPVEAPVALRGRGTTTLWVQGTRASRAPGDAHVRVHADATVVHVPFTVVELSFLDARNEPIDATRQAVGVAHAITNDASLPRQPSWESVSRDRDNVRLSLLHPGLEANSVQVVVESGPPGGPATSARRLVLERPRPGLPFRSPWLRLVGDEMDVQAPGVGDRVLKVALRDEVRVRYPATAQGVTQGVRVGRPGREDGPQAARRGHARVRVVRTTPGGMPAVGGDEAGALRIARQQIAIANEIWLQCHVSFGDPAEADVAVVDPPVASMIAVGDRDGLPARGGGEIRLRVGGRAVAPVRTTAGAPPVHTALHIASAVRALGHRARVFENAPVEFGAGRSADVQVTDAQGRPVEVTADGDRPLSTDARQTVLVAAVDLSDGLAEFDNMTAAAGSLEERALVRAVADEDPSTIDLIIVNHFTGGTRQGEAFIEADGGSIINTVILDRNGIRQEREAWTQSHEMGHVLLNQPYHPDNVGPDRPWLLMDADSSLGLVTGPKRLTRDECDRVRTHSGAAAVPPLLRRDAD